MLRRPAIDIIHVFVGGRYHSGGGGPRSAIFLCMKVKFHSNGPSSRQKVAMEKLKSGGAYEGWAMDKGFFGSDDTLALRQSSPDT